MLMENNAYAHTKSESTNGNKPWRQDLENLIWET
jgi:hypothetical protein